MPLRECAPARCWPSCCVVQVDASFIFLAGLFVFFYITYMTDSWWYSLAGMTQILCSFPSGYLLYYGVFQQRYFGILNVLSIFIIMGIGVPFVHLCIGRMSESPTAK